ncbi:MAG: helix-turn-helix transcriptional regulator [Miltoncostaeaceae bacterium]
MCAFPDTTSSPAAGAEIRTSSGFRVYDAAGLGAALRHQRELAGLTQAQLAEAAGIQRTYLVRLENGEMTAQAERLVTLLRLLGARITVDRADW